jgi:NhaP-type Na+/H+ or K+/H+ antiporter
MAVRIRSPKDFWAGVVFLLSGVSFIVGARHLPMGSASEMGSAYFPTIVAGLLSVLGVFLVARSIVLAGEAIERIGLRELTLVMAALFAFGFLVGPAGLVAAVVVLVFVSAAGGHEFRFREVLLLSVALTALAVAVFYFGLGMPFKLWPAQ